jgi:predicted phage-related endonuclease
VIETTLSPEHVAQRLGKVTASRVSDVMAKTKTGWGASRTNYRAELIAERLTGVQAKRFVNGEMIHGIEQEDSARDAYSFVADVDVGPGGFVEHPTLAMAGASPDGLVGLDGLVEIKCPNTATHLDTLLGEPIDNRYILQMQWQMACTGRTWCDFVSYDPRLPAAMQLYIKRVPRDGKLIAELEQAVKVFLGEINTIVAELRAKYEPAEEAAA